MTEGIGAPSAEPPEKGEDSGSKWINVRFYKSVFREFRRLKEAYKKMGISLDSSSLLLILIRDHIILNKYLKYNIDKICAGYEGVDPYAHARTAPSWIPLNKLKKVIPAPVIDYAYRMGLIRAIPVRMVYRGKKRKMLIVPREEVARIMEAYYSLSSRLSDKLRAVGEDAIHTMLMGLLTDAEIMELIDTFADYLARLVAMSDPVKLEVEARIKSVILAELERLKEKHPDNIRLPGGR
jgi:hypothetical protein